MRCFAAGLAVASLTSMAVAGTADAAMIRGTADFVIEYIGGGEGEVFDPPLRQSIPAADGALR